MKQIIITLTMALGSLAGSASAAETDMNSIAVEMKKAPKFVELAEQQQEVKENETVRIKVDYIVDETGKNYVVFIQSNKPEVHERIIRMVEKMPVEPGTEGKKNNIVIEYEL
jgi:hypothetical protein